MKLRMETIRQLSDDIENFEFEGEEIKLVMVGEIFLTIVDNNSSMVEIEAYDTLEHAEEEYKNLISIYEE